MPESRSSDCERFEDWLDEAALVDEPTAWKDHLSTCADCGAQWRAHRALMTALAEERVPQLSATFAADLERKLMAEVEVRPLTGWRVLALGGYAAAATTLMSWVLDKYPLPALSIDLSTPWISATAFAAVPVTLWLAAVASRYLPPKRGTQEILGL